MNKRIKILFTIPNFDTAGSGKVVYDLVRGLDKSKFAPEICCFHNEGDYFKLVQELGVPIHIFTFATPYKPFLSLPYRVFKITQFFKTHRFDLIHSWHWSSDFTEPLAAKLAGIPFIYTKKAMGWGNKSWRWRSQLSTKIIAINMDMMTQFFLKFKAKTVYMPLGVDTSFYKQQQQSRSTPEGIVFKSSDFVIISIANLAPVKGIEILLDAVKKLNNSSIKVLIIGHNNSEYGYYLKDFYASTNVHFLGKQLDVRPYLAVADLFVIPTKNEGRKEGMPIAPLEAMASGRIVIGSNISGIKDILKKRKSLLFEPGNVLDLVSKIQAILKMSDVEKTMLQNQMRMITLENFTIESLLKNYTRIYISIAK